MSRSARYKVGPKRAKGGQTGQTDSTPSCRPTMCVAFPVGKHMGIGLAGGGGVEQKTGDRDKCEY